MDKELDIKIDINTRGSRFRQLVFGLILSSMIFAICIIIFIMGFIEVKNSGSEICLYLVLISFVLGIFSVSFVIKLKEKLYLIVDYGFPVFLAAEEIKKIIRISNIYGVNNLSGIVEKTIKDKLKNITKVKLK